MKFTKTNPKLTLYEILEVPKTASKEEIKTAFFSKAKLYHPDLNQNKNSRFLFQKFQNAYEVLSDEKKRVKYDEEINTEEKEVEEDLMQNFIKFDREYKTMFWHPEELDYEFVSKGVDSFVNIEISSMDMWNEAQIEQFVEVERT